MVPLNGAGVRDKILEQGMKTTESAAYFLGNITQGIQDTGKGALTMDRKELDQVYSKLVKILLVEIQSVVDCVLFQLD